MAWGNRGSLGGTSDKTAGTSIVMTVATTSPSAGDVVVVLVGKDNASTTDGNTSEVTSVTDSAGNTYTKAREYTNSEGGANSGATVAVFYSKLTTGLTAGSSTITANFSDTRTASAIGAHAFTCTTGATIAVASGTQGETTAGNVPSMSLSGLSSREYLFIEADACERDLVPAGNGSWSVISGGATSGGGGASNMSVGGGYWIKTDTGVTSSFTTYSPFDHAGVLVALTEDAPQTAPPVGTLSVAGVLPRLALTLGLGLGSLGLAGPAPTAVIEADLLPAQASLTVAGTTPALQTTISVPAGTLNEAGLAPGTAIRYAVTPDQGTLALVGQALNAGIADTHDPGLGELTLGTAAPTLATQVATPLGTAALAGPLPSALFRLSAPPATAALALSGPTPNAGIADTHTPDLATLNLTGAAPALVTQLRAAPAAGTLALTGLTGRLATGLTPGIASLALVAAGPGVGVAVAPAAAPTALAGLAPSVAVTGGSVFQVQLRQGTTPILTWTPTATIDWATETYTLSAGELAAITDWSDLSVVLVAGGTPVSVAWVQLEVDASAPLILLEPAAGDLGLSGPTPGLNVQITPSLEPLGVSSPAPEISTNFRTNPGVGTFSLVGSSNALALQVGVSSAALGLAGRTPAVPALVAAGSLELAGATPTRVVQTTTRTLSLGRGALLLVGVAPTVSNVPVVGVPYAPCVTTQSVAVPSPVAASVTVPTPAQDDVAVPTPTTSPFRTCS